VGECPDCKLDRMFEKLVWKPAGVIRTLKSLGASHGITGTWDVTTAVGGPGDHPLYVIELAGGKVVGDLRLVATAGDEVIGGIQSLQNCSDPENHYLLRRRRIRIAKRRRGTALLLGAANSDNYYHWMVDSVPRWKLLEAANEWNYDYVLLHGASRSFQDEVLDRLNVPKPKRLRCSKNFVHQFDRLVVPSMPFPSEQVTPWACAYLRSLFPEKLSGPNKVYLRRGDVRRRLVNETDLEKKLEKAGFVSGDPRRMKVSEQAGFLRSAKVIVSPHGAGLTNAVFAPPGALLFEIFDPRHKPRNFERLAAACGHGYSSVDGTAVHCATRKRLECEVDIFRVSEKVTAFCEENLDANGKGL
jgi:capsular polysaccharide biosynthesis protein